MRGYKEFMFERKLMARFLTNLDNVDDNGFKISAKDSLHYAYT